MARERCKAVRLSYAPQHITIGITSACNNKCKFCSYHGTDAKGYSKTYELPFTLSFEKFKRIVDMAYSGGVKKIHVCGTGEPFYNNSILQMLDYVIEIYGKVSFQTNFGKAVFDKHDYLNEIVKRADKIQSITTDVMSSNAKEHEALKCGSSYEDLMNSIAYLAERVDIPFAPTVILTRSNYKNIQGILDKFAEKGVKRCCLIIANLYSYDYSEFTSSDNVYISTDYEITAKLKAIKAHGEKLGYEVVIPLPADQTTEMCSVFWDKFQTWPVQGCDMVRGDENMIPHGCAAVVRGELNSLGYLFDYETISEAWNSEKLLEIRSDLLNGIYPSEHCKKCYRYDKEDSYYKRKVAEIEGKSNRDS